VPLHPPRMSPETEPRGSTLNFRLLISEIMDQTNLLTTHISDDYLKHHQYCLLVLDLPQHETVKACMTCGMWKPVWQLFA